MIDLIPTGPLGLAAIFAAVCLIAALLCAAFRLLTGPTLADRVVALDLMSGLLVVFLLVFRTLTGQDAYAFVALGLALIAFLATVAFAGLIERTHDRDD
ncbi:multicomponent Na+:H+ antiporter subunit F [Amaricoccus macauensis]|uniref:Multicomponent Na+:H+ antiporter subunit F n=1 Tax=Amaricoccus macauensis TaxID=57001 RepID=A0A840SDR1_9RHOB|nr:monovalent cation/H+ antiporter complex subunit F [Amaricoccus macauensis]MBB5220989.1 multicomponent Na+:H+ antiporter subunit F [Amaricoccus macauensis]